MSNVHRAEERRAEEYVMEIHAVSLAEQIAAEMMKLCREEAVKEPKEKKIDIIDIHMKTLDDLVNVNSLFTIAVFVGLSLATPGQRSLENRDECNADPNLGKRLVLFEVVAFACFLLSSLVAKVLKLHINMLRNELIKPYFDLKDLMLTVASLSSVAGIVLLTLSVVNVLEIRIGKLSCGSGYSILGTILLTLIVGLALVIYASSMVVGIIASYKSDKSDIPEETEPSNGNITIKPLVEGS